MFFIEIVLSNKEGEFKSYKQQVFLREKEVDEQKKESPIEDEPKTIVLSADANKAEEPTKEETNEIVEELLAIKK